LRRARLLMILQVSKHQDPGAAVPVCVVCPINEFAFNWRSKALVECFSQIPDPRDRRGRIHPLPVVLGLAACAVAADHSTPTEIGEWCQDAGQELLASLGARYDALAGRYLAPGRDTVARVLGRVDPDLLDCVLCRFLAEAGAARETPVPEAGTAMEQIAVDGKVLRGSRGNGFPAVTLISAYAPARGTVLAQREVAVKSNEIPALPVLLDQVALVGKVVTADALHTQDATARYLRRRGAHYVLTVKANRPKLLAAIRESFAEPGAATGVHYRSNAATARSASGGWRARTVRACRFPAQFRQPGSPAIPATRPPECRPPRKWSTSSPVSRPASPGPP